MYLSIHLRSINSRSFYMFVFLFNVYRIINMSMQITINSSVKLIRFEDLKLRKKNIRGCVWYKEKYQSKMNGLHISHYLMVKMLIQLMNWKLNWRIILIFNFIWSIQVLSNLFLLPPTIFSINSHLSVFSISFLNSLHLSSKDGLQTDSEGVIWTF